MYSKSSECNIAMTNDYLCTETCGNQKAYGTSPFCATMGQPLIYYCQTQPQPKFRQRCGNVPKDNRNCFTKAFQWYTEEHVPHPKESVKKSGDVKGFANWLDGKYEQFLQDQCDPCGYKMKHTSITEAYKFPNEPETRRKKFRVKSPWRKKRGHKETGDVTSKSSLHYIMMPKDISRPASETNEMSKAMMMSSEVVLSHYSHSCTSLRVRTDPSLTVVRSQEASQSLISVKPNKDAMKPNKDATKPNKDATKSNKDATKSLPKIHTEKPQDLLCMCPKISKRNVHTQSDPWPVKSASKAVPKSETTSQTVPKSETPSQTAQKATPCPCYPTKCTQRSHPTKIEIEFEAKPSLCQCSKELIPKADAQSQFQTDVTTCACGSDCSMKQEKCEIMPKKVRLCACEYEKKDFEKCPLEPPLTIANQNQPSLCHHCIPCKTTVVTNDGQILNRSNKTTPGPNGLACNPSYKKTTGCDGILTANPTTTNDGAQTSNQTPIANDGVQTSNHSIRMDKDGTPAGYPLFMKIVFAEKLCKF